MKVEILNKLIKKAKSKKDGVYSHNGLPYSVRKGNVLNIATSKSEICRFSFGFLVVIWRGEDQTINEIKIKLQEFLNKKD